jgi:hypothetical protein
MELHREIHEELGKIGVTAATCYEYGLFVPNGFAVSPEVNKTEILNESSSDEIHSCGVHSNHPQFKFKLEVVVEVQPGTRMLPACKARRGRPVHFPHQDVVV